MTIALPEQKIREVTVLNAGHGAEFFYTDYKNLPERCLSVKDCKTGKLFSLRGTFAGALSYPPIGSFDETELKGTFFMMETSAHEQANASIQNSKQGISILLMKEVPYIKQHRELCLDA